MFTDFRYAYESNINISLCDLQILQDKLDINMEKSDPRALYDMKLTTGMAFIYGPEGKKAHSEAIEHDRDKWCRLVVNIVGKERQGKTSLRRLLVGEDFNEAAQSTVCIDHELVDTLGSNQNTGTICSNVDLHLANVNACNVIVGKHMRQRLKKNQEKKKHIAELQSFIRATIMTYFMLFLYFIGAESEFCGLPWFPVMLLLSFSFSGLILFDWLRDGFGMAIGVISLVVHIDILLRWKSYEQYEHLDNHLENNILLIWPVMHGFTYGNIHGVLSMIMGLSMAIGICFIHTVFTELLLHVSVHQWGTYWHWYGWQLSSKYVYIESLVHF